jgi:hypothetical protein
MFCELANQKCYETCSVSSGKPHTQISRKRLAVQFMVVKSPLMENLLGGQLPHVGLWRWHVGLLFKKRKEKRKVESLKIVGGVFELPYHLDSHVLELLYHRRFIMFNKVHTL